MTVSAIAAQRIAPGTDVGGPGRLRIGAPDGGAAPAGPAFGDTLRTAVDRVDASQKTADAQVEAFVSGETEHA